MKERVCSRCGAEGHNVRTCGRRSKYRSHKHVPDAFEIDAGQAEQILVRLRPSIPQCAREPRFLDSLMLTCYLRGLLEAGGGA